MTERSPSILRLRDQGEASVLEDSKGVRDRGEMSGPVFEIGRG